ncbi:MAG TPA: hypothetical protein DHW39_04950 [Erysipelotrichaceae bacterium]|nr:hypothetical protein [Erysipelotrichaceae bacterium]
MRIQPVKSILPAAAAVLLCACGGNTDMKNSKEETVQILAVTDPHILSDRLYDDGIAMQRVIENNDGKMTDKSREILDALLARAREEKPDVLLVTGDLTNNGELVSMNDLSEAFAELEKDGIPVLVIPGNHDIAYPYAASYLGDVTGFVENVSTAQFHELMDDYGYKDSLYRDEYSFSYIYEVRENLWLMGLDANTEEEPGAIRQPTLRWAEEHLKEAKEKGIQVITFSHQNVLRQSDILWQGYVISNENEVRDLLVRYDVQWNFSGHSHLEHRSVYEGLTDICMGAVSVAPLEYARITVTPEMEVSYEKAPLGVLEEEAEQRFYAKSRSSVSKQTEGLDISLEEKEIMNDFGARFNVSVFAGKADKAMMEEEGYLLWEKYAGESLWFAYMKDVLSKAQ